jgi:hypothetical protein
MVFLGQDGEAAAGLVLGGCQFALEEQAAEFGAPFGSA